MVRHPLRPLDLKNGRVELAHGSGGRASHQLVDELFTRHFHSPQLAACHDAGILPHVSGRIAVSTDSYVVSPLFFPGGCIGDLAVNGSINDVAMSGAQPIALTVGFILEEGFHLADLDRIAAAIARASQNASVPIISGDTKVVERGKADGGFCDVGRRRNANVPKIAAVPLAGQMRKLVDVKALSCKRSGDPLPSVGEPVDQDV